MVITEPNPILRQIAQQITAFNNQELDDLIELLFSTMQEKNGAGLSSATAWYIKTRLCIWF